MFLVAPIPPSAVDMDRNTLYVSEYGNKRISAFDTETLEYVGKIGRPGKNDGEFQVWAHE